MADAGPPSVGFSENDGSVTHSSTQFRFNSEQKKTLVEYWEKGMQSCSKGVKNMIEECATIAGCTLEQVKHWINAQQKRQKKKECTSSSSSADSGTQAISVKVCRGRKRSAFQVFCHEMSSSIAGGPSKITKLSEKWAGLMESEKEEWKEKASKGIFSTVSTPEQKKRAVRELISITQENLKSLALLGVEGYTVLLNISNSDCRVLCGSDTVQEYVEAEEERGLAMDDMFFKYMCGQSYMKKKRKGNTYDDMLSAVRYELKQKYREVTGRGRIPYGDLAKLGCVITGLPHGLDLKQPSQYSSSELRLLHSCIDNVKFLEIPDLTDQEVIEQDEIVLSQ